MSDQVGIIASKEQFETIRHSDKLIFIEFYANWCEPCKEIAPIFEQLAKSSADKEDVVFYKLNIDDVPDVAGELFIYAVPTFHVYKGREQLDLLRGGGPVKLTTFVENGLKRL